MTINATLIAQMITFGILIWISMKFLWPPLTQAMDLRAQRIAEGLAAADKAALSLKDAAAKSDEELKAARVQAQEITSGANKRALQIIEVAKAAAVTEADRIKANGAAEVERQVSQAKEALRKQVGELAVLGAAKILKREIDAKAHADVLADLAARV